MRSRESRTQREGWFGKVEKNSFRVADWRHCLQLSRGSEASRREPTIGDDGRSRPLRISFFHGAAVESSDCSDNENSRAQKVLAGCSKREGRMLPWPKDFRPVGLGEALHVR